MYKFWKAGPLKFGRAKKPSKTLRDFWQFSNREYLRNDSRYPKSERNVIDSDSSRILWKKSGEIWSTNKKVLLANITTQVDFTRDRDYISALRGFCALKFLHALEIDQGYLAHTHLGRGSPQKKFNREN